jgi:aldose 1-epimerase
MMRCGVVAAVVVYALLGVSAAASAQARYRMVHTGDIVELQDTRMQLVVRILTTASNAYQMTIKGEDVIRRNWATLDDIRGRMGLNGIPLLWPYANRLDEQAFYANGQKYTFDPAIGNTGRGAVPMHGFLTGATAWKVIEAKADARSAWITTKLEFFRIPQYMKQFPFAHTLTMTYRVQDGALEVRTRVDSMSGEPMPVAIGFHPYFQLTDSNREDWTLSVGAKTHWLVDERTLPTGETQPITKLLRDPHNVAVKDVTLDDIFTDLERDAKGLATMSLKGKGQQVDVVLGPKFTTVLVLSRTGGGRGRGAAPAGGLGAAPAGTPGLSPAAAPEGAVVPPVTPGAAAPPLSPGTAQNPAAGRGATPNPNAPLPRGSVAFEPMAAISNAMNLAQKGIYKDLQTIEPGGFWEESFWVRPKGY